MDAGGLWGDEQRLADLPVGPAGSHSAEPWPTTRKPKRCARCRAQGKCQCPAGRMSVTSCSQEQAVLLRAVFNN
jgi:hypothetical protein